MEKCGQRKGLRMSPKFGGDWEMAVPLPEAGEREEGERGMWEACDFSLGSEPEMPTGLAVANWGHGIVF